jgi:uncharacterized membrane protein
MSFLTTNTDLVIHSPLLILLHRYFIPHTVSGTAVSLVVDIWERMLRELMKLREGTTSCTHVNSGI